MKLLTAMILAAVMGFVLPLVFGGRSGVWLGSFAGWGTIRPLEGSPGLLFSIPVFVAVTVILWVFFNWHSRG